MGKTIKKNQLKLYNTITAQKELFVPQHPTNVGMYVCGPTVYNNVHLGNVRTFMSFDVIYRYLKHLGYNVRYVRNITDVGHLLDNEEDKISKRAKLEQLEPMEIAQKYTVDFHQVMHQINNLPPSIEPTATGHILEQIQITQQLINNGLAYVVNGSVYFDVIKYHQQENYGELSKRKIEDLIANTRELDGQTEKKNPQDFALWKKAADEHIMRWQSPWGEGFPGWHLECTVMSTKYLGKSFDIHGGGMDLKFPHHECEIAQAKAAYQQNPVKYWLHTNMLTLNGQKMSKSTGNTINPDELFSGKNDFFSKGFSPMAIRFFMLQAHYRSPLDLSNDAVLASEKGYHRLTDAMLLLPNLPVSEHTSCNVKDWQKGLYDAMDDDFNTPILIARLFDGVKMIHLINDKKEQINPEDLTLLSTTFNQFVVDVLGLKQDQNQQNSKLNATIKMLINIRNQARADKNWSLSDQIRDELANNGIELKDTKDGSAYSF